MFPKARRRAWCSPFSWREESTLNIRSVTEFLQLLSPGSWLLLTGTLFLDSQEMALLFLNVHTLPSYDSSCSPPRAEMWGQLLPAVSSEWSSSCTCQVIACPGHQSFVCRPLGPLLSKALLFVSDDCFCFPSLGCDVLIIFESSRAAKDASQQNPELSISEPPVFLSCPSFCGNVCTHRS